MSNAYEELLESAENKFGQLFKAIAFSVIISSEIKNPILIAEILKLTDKAIKEVWLKIGEFSKELKSLAEKDKNRN